MHDPACRAWLSESIDHSLKPPTAAQTCIEQEERRSENGSAEDFAPEARGTMVAAVSRRAISRVSTR